MIHSSRGVFEVSTLHAIHVLQLVLQHAVSCLLSCTFTALLCIICAGSVWQGIGHMVLVLALIVFLLDLSLQQFMLVLKGDSCALGDWPKSTLLLE